SYLLRPQPPLSTLIPYSTLFRSPLMFGPFGRLLVEGRRETSAVGAIRTNAIAEHGKVLRALESGDPNRARRAMSDHLAQTADDLDRKSTRLNSSHVKISYAFFFS